MNKQLFQSSDRMAPYRLSDAPKKSLKLKVSRLAIQAKAADPGRRLATETFDKSDELEKLGRGYSHLRFHGDRINSLSKKSDKKHLVNLLEERGRQSDKKSATRSKFLVTLSRFSYGNVQKSDMRHREASGGKTLHHQ